MNRNYIAVSPSLRGIFSHQSLSYEGIVCPEEITRFLDSPIVKNREDLSQKEQKVMDQYFHDLHKVFLKKLSDFMVSADSNYEEKLKLQAMLQELIKIKEIVAG